MIGARGSASITRTQNPASFHRRLERLAAEAEAYGRAEQDVAALFLAHDVGILAELYGAAHDAVQNAKDIAAAEVVRLRAERAVSGGTP